VSRSSRAAVDVAFANGLDDIPSAEAGRSLTATAAERAAEFTAAAELVGRQCTRRTYERMSVPGATRLRSEVIAYASPDSTYAVTRELMMTAERSILIGIYDFTAPYVADLLLAAARRGVLVTVMIDLDKRKGEPEVWDSLVAGGCTMVPAPSCASVSSRYFPSCHEKVIVIDDDWSLVQSGNYSENSIPPNEGDGTREPTFSPGNRDMGIAVRSPELASYFTRVLQRDIELERVGGAELRLEELEAVPPLDVAAPTGPPVLFPSCRLDADGDIEVTPVISPENYLPVVTSLLKGATSSIAIEQQYIRSRQPHVAGLVALIGSRLASNPGVDVRVVIGAPIGRHDKFRLDLEAMEGHGLEIGRHVRVLNPDQFVHCHNKLIVVDDRIALVSSQNWSDFAVSLNREVGLLIQSESLASYYREIFDSDWSSAVDPCATETTGVPTGGEANGTVRLRVGDFLEV
jgi:phosphatidylserine/phosphatidylglycerophosphate/cardiolipin synthase-like enzyme